jgi:hypothetical protein
MSMAQNPADPAQLYAKPPIFLEELVAELHAAALIAPGILLPRVEAERHRCIDRKGDVLNAAGCVPLKSERL